MNIKLQSALLDISKDFDKTKTPSISDLNAKFEDLAHAVGSGDLLKQSKVSHELAVMLVKWRVENL